MENDPSSKASLPESVAPSGTLERLAETAQDYARAAASEATLRAYASDWAHFTRWCRKKGIEALTPDPQVIGLYLADCASQPPKGAQVSVATIERRLAGIGWAYRQRGLSFHRQDPHIASVMAGIRRKHARPPVRKEALYADELLAMAATLPRDLRGLRNRALLLTGFAGGMRRSEIVGLDVARDDTPDGRGWIEIEPEGAFVVLRGKTGWREIEIGRGSGPASCPVAALEKWMEFGRVDFGPLFSGVSKDGTRRLETRISDRLVARLIKQTTRDAGIRPKLSDAERLAAFSGHSLRAGLATSAAADEADIQRQLGHASAEMTRRYQRRRDRFRTNLTKAAGL